MKNKKVIFTVNELAAGFINQQVPFPFNRGKRNIAAHLHNQADQPLRPPSSQRFSSN